MRKAHVKQRTAYARMRYQGEWYNEGPAVTTVLTDSKLEMSIPTTNETGSKKDTVKITATSQDGKHYKGIYRYEKGSYDPGEVRFVRAKRPDGADVFTGEWIERDSWILDVKP